MLFQKLLQLLQGGASSKTLKDILGAIMGGGGAMEALVSAVKKRAKAQVGRTSGKTLGFATVKSIAAVQGPGIAGMSLEQRVQLGKAHAERIALQYAQVGELCLAFADVQGALERARGTPGEDAARAEREKVEEKLIQAAIDIGRVAAGDDPRDL